MRKIRPCLKTDVLIGGAWRLSHKPDLIFIWIRSTILSSFSVNIGNIFEFFSFTYKWFTHQSMLWISSACYSPVTVVLCFRGFRSCELHCWTVLVFASFTFTPSSTEYSRPWRHVLRRQRQCLDVPHWANPVKEGAPPWNMQTGQQCSAPAVVTTTPVGAASTYTSYPTCFSQPTNSRLRKHDAVVSRRTRWGAELRDLDRVWSSLCYQSVVLKWYSYYIIQTFKALSVAGTCFISARNFYIHS